MGDERSDGRRSSCRGEGGDARKQWRRPRRRIDHLLGAELGPEREEGCPRQGRKVRLAAMAGKITVAEVEQLVQPGEIDPDMVHVPGIYVHRIFQGSNYEKRIERRTLNTQI